MPTRGSFPLGLGYLAAVLLRAGFEVELLDFNIRTFSRAAMTRLLIAKAKECDGVGFSGMVTMLGTIQWMAQVVKQVAPHVPVVVGGSVASPMPEFLLQRTAADIACIGEGEETVCELANALEKNEPIGSVLGLCIKEGKTIYRTGTRPLIKNLDALPFPAWDHFEIHQYAKNNYFVNTPYRSMNLIAGRGCPYRCTFCYRNFGNRVRVRSVENILLEIETLIERYGVHHFDFQDELFTLNDAHVRQFCSKVIEKRLNITWRCLGRVNLAEGELYKLMKAAGCHWLGFGIESGSPKMLKVMDKRINLDEARQAIALGRQAGIHVTGTFIMGLPGENSETISETVRFCKENKLYNKPFYPVPYPGTLLFESLVRSGTLHDGNMESLIGKMERDATELIINLTDMSDTDLIRLKEDAESEIRGAVAGTRGFKALILLAKETAAIWGISGLVRLFFKMTARKWGKLLKK
ncbi:MAG: hypothetical protein A2293_01300 [Elusimicrobia bacterium RIFOXYB2_FULL_49_7]|nr:MAG: hypothetical protein A2293_01300 [Elusimicrobia bacterium RIFOXYB2_FULL_49_7]